MREILITLWTQVPEPVSDGYRFSMYVFENHQRSIVKDATDEYVSAKDDVFETASRMSYGVGDDG